MFHSISYKQFIADTFEIGLVVELLRSQEPSLQISNTEEFSINFENLKSNTLQELDGLLNSFQRLPQPAPMKEQPKLKNDGLLLPDNFFDNDGEYLTRFFKLFNV